MRDIREVLRQKETDVARVRMEIDALRSVIPLLSDETHHNADVARPSAPRQQNKWPLDIGTSTHAPA